MNKKLYNRAKKISDAFLGKITPTKREWYLSPPYVKLIGMDKHVSVHSGAVSVGPMCGYVTAVIVQPHIAVQLTNFQIPDYGTFEITWSDQSLGKSILKGDCIAFAT